MSNVKTPPLSTHNERRLAAAVLLLARELGAEAAVRAALHGARPDLELGPGDPPDPG